MNTFTKGQCVINNKTGYAYMITTDTVQTRNRRQVVGTGIRNPEVTQIAESHLDAIGHTAALICFSAEKILRGKHKLTEDDKQVLTMYRAFKKSIIK